MGRAYEVRKASIQKNGAIKAKLYSNYAKEIYLIAKKGTAEIESNINLKRIVEKAKKDQVPTDIIKRAIDKAKSSGGEDYSEIMYEGFGPGNSTLIIKCLTDNVNRTVSYVRTAFNKVHKTLGVTNSVSYNYDYLAVLAFNSNLEEEIFEALINNEVDIIDIENNENEITISCKPSNLTKVKDVIESIVPNVEYIYDEIGMYAKDMVKLSSEDQEVFNILFHLLDEIEDVTAIYHNVKLD